MPHSKFPSKTFSLALTLLLLAGMLFAGGVAQAQNDSLAVRGVAVTGSNSLLGQQLMDFGTGVSAGNDLVAAFNPNGPEPLPLTPSTPLGVTPEGAQLTHVVVVLHSDQMVYAMRPTLSDAGFPPGVVAHPQLQFSVRGTRLVE